MDFFFDNLGVLFFLFFLFLQFIGSLIGQRTRGKRAPNPVEADEAPASSSGPSAFEEALRQIQEALQEASQPASSRSGANEPRPSSEEDEAFPTVADDEYAPAFEHFDDFEQHGDAHFSSGAHEQYEAAEARREALFDRPLKTDRPTLMERVLPDADLRGNLSVSRVDAPVTPTVRSAGTASEAASVARLRSKLRSPEDVQDAYRLHVILSRPRSMSRR
ncbi:MAG: hypothetical protein AAFP18_16850 [Bacteroidota bacterium]